MTTTLTPSLSPTPTPPPHQAIAATRSSVDVIRSVPNMLRAEWIKLTSIRSNGAIVALTVAVGGLVSWALPTYAAGGNVLSIAEVFTFAGVFTAVFAAVAGILSFSSEAQHGTLGPTLSAQPARSVTAFSKTVMASVFGAFLGAAGLLAGIAGAAAAGLELGDTSTMLTTGAWAVLFTSTSAVLGLGIGMIARHSSAAISGLLVWWLVVENLLSAFVAERFSRFLPFVAGNGLLGVQTGPEASEVSDLALTTTQNALVFGTYAAAAVAIGTVLLYRRDTN